MSIASRFLAESQLTRITGKESLTFESFFFDLHVDGITGDVVFFSEMKRKKAYLLAYLCLLLRYFGKIRVVQYS